MKIIHPNENGITVITPNPEWDINDVARKDVPFAAPYLIVEDEEIPNDRTFRDAWTADFSASTLRGLGPQRWFIERAEKEIELIKSHEPTDDPVLQQERADAIERNLALIAQMKEEVFQIEGVRL